MGGDGGSIPKRDDLVKTRAKPEQVGKTAEIMARWKHCALTQEQLRSPIVSCQLGRLFNKESFIEFLLDRSKFEFAEKFSYIRGLKDVKELNFSENSAFTTVGSKFGCLDLVSPFICPLTGLEMNGRYRFCYLLGCGCVFSDRALKELKASICTKCGKTYTDNDIIIINGTEEEMAQMQMKMDERRILAKSTKVAKKRKTPVETPTEESTIPVSESGCVETTTDLSLADPTKSDSAAGSERGAHQSKLARGSASSKQGSASLPDGQSKKPKTIQDDPKASAIFKSLFNTHATAKNQTRAHWVTYNPQYF